MISFMEKLQRVNDYKKTNDKQRLHKNTDSNNSYDAKDREAIKNDIVTEVKLCIYSR